MATPVVVQSGSRAGQVGGKGLAETKGSERAPVFGALVRYHAMWKRDAHRFTGIDGKGSQALGALTRYQTWHMVW